MQAKFGAWSDRLQSPLKRISTCELNVEKIFCNKKLRNVFLPKMALKRTKTRTKNAKRHALCTSDTASKFSKGKMRPWDHLNVKRKNEALTSPQSPGTSPTYWMRDSFNWKHEFYCNFSEMGCVSPAFTITSVSCTLVLRTIFTYKFHKLAKIPLQSHDHARDDVLYLRLIKWEVHVLTTTA